MLIVRARRTLNVASNNRQNTKNGFAHAFEEVVVFKYALVIEAMQGEKIFFQNLFVSPETFRATKRRQTSSTQDASQRIVHIRCAVAPITRYILRNLANFESIVR